MIVTGCTTINLPDESGMVEVVLDAQTPTAACSPTLCDAGICAETDGGTGEECPPGFGNCNIDPDDGCEVDITTSLDHCGGCDMPCRTPHGTPRCADGSCELVTCEDDFFDCDSDPRNGCETSIRTLTDCGRCRMPGESPLCALDHATETCESGTCELVGCHDGWADCDGVLANGCETPLGTGSDCSTCADACDAATPNCDVSGASPTCVTTCPAGTTLCGTSCTDTDADARNCGACGARCTIDNAEATCTAGSCTTGACDPGWASCDSSDASGCETSATTLTDCGGCDTACAVDDAVTDCHTGTCTISECYGPRGDCNADASDGCEADLASATTCGDCMTSCAPPTAICAAPPLGTGCVESCAAPAEACGDRCLDVRFDDDNCGGCGTRCDPTNLEYCSFGVCKMVVCAPGFEDCDGILRNECEAFIDGDIDNCGACGTVCPTGPGASPSCIGGSCRLNCEPGRGDCNGDPHDGCEVDFTTTDACGTCGNACSFANATAACNAGTCEMASCNDGFADCNTSPGDGCEAHVDNDTDNCGTCGNHCRGNRRECCSGSCQDACP